MNKERLKEKIDKRNLDSQQYKAAFLELMRTIFYNFTKITGKVPKADAVLNTAIALTTKSGSSDPVVNKKMGLKEAIVLLLESEGLDYLSHKKIDYPAPIEDIKLESNPNLLIDDLVLDEFNKVLYNKRGNDIYLVDTPHPGDTFIFVDRKNPKLSYAFGFIADLKREYASRRMSLFSALDNEEKSAECIKNEFIERIRRFIKEDPDFVRVLQEKSSYYLGVLKEDLGRVDFGFDKKLEDAISFLERIHKYDSLFPYDDELRLLYRSKERHYSNRHHVKYSKEQPSLTV